MNHIFSPDSPAMRALGRMADLMILSFLWIACCIPIVTIGPATSALYYVSLKIVRKEDPPIFKTFCHGLKDNLLQGIVQTVIFLIGGICFCLNYRLIFLASGAARTILIIVYWILFVCCISTVIHTFALQAQFRNSVTATIRNGFMLSLQKPVHTVLVLIIHALPIGLYLLLPTLSMRITPVVICLGPALIAHLCAKGFALIFAPLIAESLAYEKEQQAQAEAALTE